ncbi:MAG: c-type cytochrome domain-containing protein, partial [Planctomycetota bacterium]
MRFLFSLIGLSVAAIAASAAELPKKVTFEEHIKPILRQHCMVCHNQGEMEGGLALDTYGALIEGGGSGEIVFDDGDVDGSRLWQLVNHDDEPVMPPSDEKLPAEQLALIRAWIEGGVLENSGSVAKKKKNTALAFVATAGGKPEGPVAMPETTPLDTPVVTSRAPAISALAASPWAPLIAVSGQNQVVLYHSETSELLGVLPFPEGIPQDLKFSRDGSYLIAGGGRHSALGLVAIYDVKTGQRVGTVGDEFDTVFGADVNETMTRVALGGPQRMLRIYDFESGEVIFDIKKHTDWIYAVAYSPDGVLVASADRAGGISVWEAETGRHYLDLVGHKGAVYSLSWRDDSNVLASASGDGTVKLWELNDGKAIRTINAHGGGATSVSFDHQGRVATAGADNRIKLWDAAGKELKSFAHGSEDMLEVAVTHDGNRLIGGNWSGEVFNCSVADPKNVTRLAANPTPLKARADALKQSLVSAQQKIEPVRQALDQAKQQLTAAKKPLFELQTQIDDVTKKIAGLESTIAATKSSIDQSAKQLPAATSVSRDLQDLVTAERVAVKSDPSRQSKLAELELKLASHLTTLAKQRQAKLQAEVRVPQFDGQLKTLQSSLAELTKKKQPLQQQIAQAESVVEVATKNFEAASAVAGAIESKLSRYEA